MSDTQLNCAHVQQARSGGITSAGSCVSTHISRTIIVQSSNDHHVSLHLKLYYRQEQEVQ